MIEKDAAYRKAAISFNEKMATFAKDLAQEIGHPAFRHLGLSIAAHHRKHLRTQRAALRRLEEKQASSAEEIGTIIQGEKTWEVLKANAVSDVVLESVEAHDAEGLDKESIAEVYETDDVETPSTEELNAQIDALHGSGAAAALDAAYADGSIFSDANRPTEAETEEDVKNG